MKERNACFWATPCGRGCQVGANYQSTTVHLPPAMATGNLDLIPNAHAREVNGHDHVFGAHSRGAPQELEQGPVGAAIDAHCAALGNSRAQQAHA